MMRLIIGRVDSLALARNARTSQQMVDKFYAAHLTTAQVRKQLHYMPSSSPAEDTTKTTKTTKKTPTKKTAKVHQ
jgi:hypothetical protein